MERTKIDWCDSTWNPVTGCKHGCEYCYARNIAHRFGGWMDSGGDTYHDTVLKDNSDVRELDSPLSIMRGERSGNYRWQCAPYPYDFTPTLHRYRLGDYENKSGRNIFVCSMADLFGCWVPDEWIEEVFEACKKAPQHNYLFLTKNPARYVELINNTDFFVKTGSNMWFGYSATLRRSVRWWNPNYNIFASVEPILEPMQAPRCKWLIIGAETGNRIGKVIPERKWIEDIVNQCRERGTPVFMKESLSDIWGEPLIQELPEALKNVGHEKGH